MRMRIAAVVTQCAWRVKMARRELRKLKMVILKNFLYFFLIDLYQPV